jgi:hypothetical protein
MRAVSAAEEEIQQAVSMHSMPAGWSEMRGLTTTSATTGEYGQEEKQVRSLQARIARVEDMVRQNHPVRPMSESVSAIHHSM